MFISQHKVGDRVVRLPKYQGGAWERILKSHSLDPEGIYTVVDSMRSGDIQIKGCGSFWSQFYFQNVSSIEKCKIEDFL